MLEAFSKLKNYRYALDQTPLFSEKTRRVAAIWSEIVDVVISTGRLDCCSVVKSSVSFLHEPSPPPLY
jgi:hypothetical protein